MRPPMPGRSRVIRGSERWPAAAAGWMNSFMDGPIGEDNASSDAVLDRRRAPRIARRRALKLLSFLARRFAWTPHASALPSADSPPSGGAVSDAVVVFVH